MWIFEGILYVILLLVFIRYDRKKRFWKKTVSQEEEFEHYLSELSVAYGKQKNIEEAVAEVEETHKITLPVEHSYARIYGAMCAIIREDGDILAEGYSVFQKNLQYLKEEIRENLLLCKRCHERVSRGYFDGLLAVIDVNLDFSLRSNRIFYHEKQHHKDDCYDEKSDDCCKNC